MHCAARRILFLVLILGGTPAYADDSAVDKRQIGQMVLEGVPEWDARLRDRMFQYLQIRQASVAGINETGTELMVRTRFGEVSQLHRLAMPMGARSQVTFFDEPVGGGDFIPGSNGTKFAFTKDWGGNENDQVFVYDMAGGRYKMLTDGKSRHDDAVISHDGALLAFSGTARNGRDFDIYVADAAGKIPPRLVYQVEGNYYPSEFSPDDSKLLVMKYISARETHWFVVDIASGEGKQITPAEGDQFYGGGVWSHDGKSVYLTSDRDGEFRKLYRLELASNEWTCLTDDINWDVSSVAVDPAGKGIVIVTNEDALSRMYFADADGSRRQAIDSLPKGRIGGVGFAAKGGVLGLTLMSATSAADAYTMTFPAGKLTRWTQSEVGGLDTSAFVDPEIIHYPTFDSDANGAIRKIPALYYKAKGAGPHPVVIHAHGGPESQERGSLRGYFQYWLNELGISIISPNVRGSTGYGRTFHQLDNGVLREDSVRDVGALLDWIAQQPELDASRVGIFGGSYGGYMVMGSLVNYPNRIRAGIDVVGITDFVTFLENTSEYRRDLRRAEYGDERDPKVRAVLERISPLRNAHKIEAALFVVQGANDPRVPRSEAEQIVAKMRELNRPVWYALALNEGHGFAKRENADMAAIMYALFWEKHLLN